MDSTLGAVGAADADMGAALAIGCSNAVSRGALGERLVAFTKASPGIEIGVHGMAPAALLPALRADVLSIVIMPGQPVDDLESAILWTDQVAVAMPVGHRLACRTAIAPAELPDEHFLIPLPAQTAEMYRFLARRVGLLDKLGGTLCNDSQSRMLDRVAAGDGLALLCLGQAPLEKRDVAVKTVSGAASQFDIRSYWKNAADPAVANLVATLRQKR